MVMLKRPKEQQYVLDVIRGKAVATVDVIERIYAKPLNYWMSPTSQYDAYTMYNATQKHIKKHLVYSTEEPKQPFGFACPVPFGTSDDEDEDDED